MVRNIIILCEGGQREQFCGSQIYILGFDDQGVFIALCLHLAFSLILHFI